jgi:uncharacterized membrane protein
MKKSRFAMLIVALAISISIKAQLKFKNSETSPIYIAIAYYVSGSDFNGWYSEGWFKIEPGETKSIIPTIAYNTYYYYAKDENDKEWAGSGKYQFVINSKESFNIKNADMDYQKDYFAHKVMKNFRKITLSNEVVGKSAILSLTDQED